MVSQTSCLSIIATYNLTIVLSKNINNNKWFKTMAVGKLIPIKHIFVTQKNVDKHL